jgi:hypothetical protein
MKNFLRSRLFVFGLLLANVAAVELLDRKIQRLHAAQEASAKPAAPISEGGGR